MHIQGALRLLREDRLPRPLAAAATAYPWCYHLGAFLVDLPLFDRFALKVALFLVKRPYPESRWGGLIHAHGCGSLAAELLRRAQGEHQEPLRALLAGLLTHLAMDRVMHVPIEEACKAHLRLDETHAQLHEALENYQSLIWHRAHLGCDGLQTSWLDSLEVGPDGTRSLPRWLAPVISQCFGQVWGATPTLAEVDRWAFGIVGYRTLLKTPMGAIAIRSSERLGRERSWVAEVELQPAFDRAIELATSYLDAAGRALDDPSIDLAAEIGDGPLV